MVPVLRLYEDVLSSDALDVRLPALPRMLFVVHGTVVLSGRSFGDDEAWYDEGEVALNPGKHGVTYWRFELAPAGAREGIAVGPGVTSRELLSAALETLPQGGCCAATALPSRPAAALICIAIKGQAF